MTLVEVLAVVVILGLLAGTLMMGFAGTFGRGKHELAKTGIAVIQSKLEQYNITQSTWPGNDVGLRALTDGMATPADPFYLSPGQLRDPWDRQYMLVVPGPNGHPFEIITYGADGQPGGTAENADISSVNLRGDRSVQAP